jgi:hypothetical protein
MKKPKWRAPENARFLHYSFFILHSAFELCAVTRKTGSRKNGAAL